MEMVEQFQNPKNQVSVFCISLKAGGTGLNLTAADIVIHYDHGGIRQLRIRRLIVHIELDKNMQLMSIS